MNKGNVSENRIQWTTLALNHCLPLHNDIKNLRICKEDRRTEFPGGTVTDAHHLQAVLTTKLGVTPTNLGKFTKFKGGLWYTGEIAVDPIEIPSDRLEMAYSNVSDFYIKHQDVWDSAEEVEGVTDESFYETDVEMDEDEPDY
jgi:hypothetical protein